jgi:hypothetical protein
MQTYGFWFTILMRGLSMKLKNYVCVFSSNTEEETSDVQTSLHDGGIEYQLKINNKSDLFGIGDLHGPSHLFTGTYQILVEESEAEAALTILEKLFSSAE